MNEIKCPHCGEVFKVDASGYADIVKQVRDAEFSRDLDERVKAVQREGEQALELERSRSTAALQEAESQRDTQLAEQKNAAAQELAKEVAKRDAELAELRAKLEGDLNAGKITLSYYSQDDLQRVWDALARLKD